MILEVGISLLAVAGFGVALWRCRLVAATERTVASSVDGLMSMLDSELDDRAKETAVRRAGFALIVSGFGLLWRSAVALAAAAVPILLADALGVVSRDAVLDLMMRPDYVLLVSVLGIMTAVAVRRRRPVAAPAAADDPYPTGDRLLHAMAFASPHVLRTASRIEDRLLRDGAREPSGPPIFVTSLARAGTTALLNALHEVPGIATHTYRDMPFLTAPSLWNRVAGGARRRVEARERAHGDGLQIDLESPEAFEEVIWKMFWPEKYQGPTIGLWRPADRRPEAERFLERHMGKVVRARLVQAGDDGVTTARYCSKNNANIARIPYLVEAFPGCRIVVPIRRPECHAASSLRQHRNFLARQADDDFVRRYMRDLGHYEFGLVHKPVRFPGFDPGRYDPTTPDYWLDHWIHAFREVLTHGASCVLVSQDVLRASPQGTMTNLCDVLGLDPSGVRFETYFRSTADESPTDVYDPELYAEAAALYDELERLALPATAQLSA